MVKAMLNKPQSIDIIGHKTPPIDWISVFLGPYGDEFGA